MRKVSTSVVFAVLNLFLVGFALMLTYANLSDLAILIEMVLLPLALLATAVFAIRDLLRRSTRVHAVVAVLLSVPGVLLVFSINLR